MKWYGTLVLAVFAMFPAYMATAGDTGVPAGPSQLDFFLGEWDIVSLGAQPDGSFVESRARSKVSKILDGSAIFDEWRSLDDNGQVVFRGASFRTWLPRQGKWEIIWMMANVKGYTEIEAELADGAMHMIGKGYDPYGEFVERATYYDISEEGYKFTMDRSYDGGQHWISPFNKFTARRAK